MTSDQITQLRQLLKQAKEGGPATMILIDQALALLSCPTCNGTSKVPYVPIGGMFPDPRTPGPCSDCK